MAADARARSAQPETHSLLDCTKHPLCLGVSTVPPTISKQQHLFPDPVQGGPIKPSGSQLGPEDSELTVSIEDIASLVFNRLRWTEVGGIEDLVQMVSQGTSPLVKPPTSIWRPSLRCDGMALLPALNQLVTLTSFRILSIRLFPGAQLDDFG